MSFVLAPMKTCSMSLGNLEWYDEDAVTAAVSTLSIDCVLVDGPVAYRKGTALSRYPALPAIRNKLADSYVVFLDDIRRAGEQEILRRWSAELAIEFRRFPGRGGISQGTKGKAFASQL